MRNILSRSDSLASNFSWLQGWKKWEKNSADRIAFYNALKTSESHRLYSTCPAPKSFFSLMWLLTCLVPQGTGLGTEMQTTLIISRPVKSHMKQGTRSVATCIAWSHSSWNISSILPQLCLPFSGKPIHANYLAKTAIDQCLACLLPGCSVPRQTEVVLSCDWHGGKVVLRSRTSLVCHLVGYRSSHDAADQPMAVMLVMKGKYKPPEKSRFWFCELFLFQRSEK